MEKRISISEHESNWELDKEQRKMIKVTQKVFKDLSGRPAKVALLYEK